MLYLCISDIQGNLDALRAVMATAERRSFSKLLVAGDLVFPGPEPLETWRRLNAAGAILVQGVTDRALSALDPKALKPETDRERQLRDRFVAVREALGDVILERIRRLPPFVRLPLEDGTEMVLVHGSPHDHQVAMSHDMTDEELLALVGDDPASLVVCGMSHVPFDRTVADVRIVNVGSVGDAPDGLGGSGGPVLKPRIAHATWIESRPGSLTVEQVHIPLDS
jgi:predicted phosphodiesterase